MKNILEKCIRITAILMFSCFSIAATCGVLEFIVTTIEYFIREKPPILEVITIGSIFSGVLLIGVLIVMAIVYIWLYE